MHSAEVEICLVDGDDRYSVSGVLNERLWIRRADGLPPDGWYRFLLTIDGHTCSDKMVDIVRDDDGSPLVGYGIAEEF